MKFLVEVICEHITPVIVEADSERVARQMVQEQQGEPGDSYPGEVRLGQVRLLDEGGAA